jgi:hypothetical protein
MRRRVRGGGCQESRSSFAGSSCGPELGSYGSLLTSGKPGSDMVSPVDFLFSRVRLQGSALREPWGPATCFPLAGDIRHAPFCAVSRSVIKGGMASPRMSLGSSPASRGFRSTVVPMPALRAPHPDGSLQSRVRRAGGSIVLMRGCSRLRIKTHRRIPGPS